MLLAARSRHTDEIRSQMALCLLDPARLGGGRTPGGVLALSDVWIKADVIAPRAARLLMMTVGWIPRQTDPD